MPNESLDREGAHAGGVGPFCLPPGEALNFSEWDREQDEGEDAAETVADGEMPPLRYELAHAEARLSEAEKRRLIRGLTRTLGGEDNSGPGS